MKEKECVKSEINQIMLLADYRFRALTSVQMNYQQGIFHVIFTLSECLRSMFSTFSRKFLVENVEIFTQWLLDITDTDEPVVESVQKVIIFFLYIFTYHLFS